MLLAKFIENIAANWECNLMAEKHRCVPPCRWATGAAREERTCGRQPAIKALLSFRSCFTLLSPLSFFPPSNALSPFVPRRRKWEQSAGRTATFLCMLCWLGWTLPLRGWWGGMALWRNQPGASIAVIIIWIRDCWICTFGPLRGWEMTCLRSPDTLSVCGETTHLPSAATLPHSTLSARVDERFFNDWRGHSIRPATTFFTRARALSQSAVYRRH